MDLAPYGGLEKQAGLTSHETLKVLQQILSALKYLHKESRIAHNDIKPANILVFSRKDINIKLCDFNCFDSCISPMTSRLGTRQYFSPGKWRRDYSELADVFALGVMLLELCSFGGLDGPDTLPPMNSKDARKEDVLMFDSGSGGYSSKTKESLREYRQWSKTLGSNI